MIYEDNNYYKDDYSGVEWRQSGQGRVCPKKFNTYLERPHFVFNIINMSAHRYSVGFATVRMNKRCNITT